MAHPLEEANRKPIPALDSMRAAKLGYRKWHINHMHEQGKECLVDAIKEDLIGANYYFQDHNPPYGGRIPGSLPHLYVREGVAERLMQANALLKAAGLQLYLLDAWRPASVQHHMSSAWAPQHVRAMHPEWSDEDVRREAAQYWAHGPETEAAIDSDSPPPHSTGGAIDLTLVQADGEPLPMGTPFDSLSARSYTDALELSGGQSDVEARENRRTLYWAMHAAGFANNPTEWWHYSYGDQMWAALTTAQIDAHVSAVYSNIMPG